MFSASAADLLKEVPVSSSSALAALHGTTAARLAAAGAVAGGLIAGVGIDGGAGADGDSFVDAEGYFTLRIGEVLSGRYRVVGYQGKGVFSNVLRVHDLADQDREYVVKVIRNKEVMRAAGLREAAFLKTLAANDPENRRHIVRLQACFDHKEHLCLVFEPMSMNLREFIRNLGGTGCSLMATRRCAKQLLTALKHLKRCRILHADIKPDNILVDEAMSKVLLCDFGSAASLDSPCEVTEYLASRYYRAPEVIVGLEYSEASDMWAAGTVLYELFTGKILFPGDSNNEMLRMMMEVCGEFRKKILRPGKFAYKHFDDTGAFLMKRKDPLTQQELRYPVHITEASKSLKQMLMASGTLSAYEMERVPAFCDLLLKMLTLDPAKRITPEDALKHPFIAQS